MRDTFFGICTTPPIKNQMVHPLSNVPRSGYFTARDQSMVESGVTEGGENTASFTNMKPQAKKQRFLSYPRRETATSGGKRCR